MRINKRKSVTEEEKWGILNEKYEWKIDKKEKVSNRWTVEDGNKARVAEPPVNVVWLPSCHEDVQTLTCEVHVVNVVWLPSCHEDVQTLTCEVQVVNVVWLPSYHEDVQTLTCEVQVFNVVWLPPCHEDLQTLTCEVNVLAADTYSAISHKHNCWSRGTCSNCYCG
jgi:hypothetical protein